MWCDDVALVGNTIVNNGLGSTAGKYGVRIYRTNDGITIARNTIQMPNAAQSYASAVYATGTGGTSRPTNVTVVDNDITCASPSPADRRPKRCGRFSTRSGPPAQTRRTRKALPHCVPTWE